MADRNFLLGRGERLTQGIPPLNSGGPKKHPYNFEEAISRLAPKAEELVKGLENLPALACPRDEAVGIITLHPSYMAKSFFPEGLLASAGLRSVGSRSTVIKPEKWARKGPPEEVETVEIFVAGKRKNFADLAELLVGNDFDSIAHDIIKVEDFRLFHTGERIKNVDHTGKQKLEVAIHTNGTGASQYILEGLQNFFKKVGGNLDFDRGISVAGLSFFPAIADYEAVKNMEQFSYLRVIRQMPTLRTFAPMFRNKGRNYFFKCDIPDIAAVDPGLAVAIFDGGVPSGHSYLDRWVDRRKSKNLKKPLKDGLEHGLGVTSAFLFGPFVKGTMAPTPYANVVHYRVVDENLASDQDLFDVLPRIKTILERNEHEFVNLSIGPDIPINDNEVEVWTSVLDTYLSSGKVFATIAVGNNGESDPDLGLARVLVPSDCVNGVAVGATDKVCEGTWQRAAYSCIGPGRSPGVVKPDIVAFGGSEGHPFYVLGLDNPGYAVPQQGTSFAAPLTLRMAAGVRSHFGKELSPLAIKALLINKSKNLGYGQIEVGWGKVPNAIDDLVVCSEGCVSVVYQGELEPKKYIRAQIPVPVNITGDITISATLCYASETDPQDTCSYTRSGIEVIFRPHEEKIDDDAKQAKSSSFFSQSKLYKTESELRKDAHKWETALHAKVTKRGTSLKNPIFDIHYNAREFGGDAKKPSPIPYAMVITIESKVNKKIYDDVLRRYRHQLEPLVPVIEIPIQV